MSGVWDRSIIVNLTVMSQKPVVDQDACVGCQTCLSVCPAGELFKMNDEGKAEFVSENQDNCIESQVCVNSCPAGAISMVSR
ncbi:4Fe4S ferredoxin [Blattamonas nauphoetae]|uniref:4Fe4S ferredoxin n=1 Tax=Blattamonas nauphoetae TaxID=2049346 RepID=A0ABQ9XCA2_9EUKA|nr:4Fe4S ferredoxin [Blattamonas nauphoetae]